MTTSLLLGWNLSASRLELVRALARSQWEEAMESILVEPDRPEGVWTEELLEEALVPFIEEYGEIVFDHQARLAQNTRIEKTAPRQWEISQVLADPEGDNLWAIEGTIDLRSETDFEGPLLRLQRIGT